MPRVSKYRELSSKKKDLFVDDLYSAITSMKDKDEVRAFFEDILTPEEKMMLSKRFQIAMMLQLGYLWQEIDSRVKVTETTINKIRMVLSFGFGGLKKVAQRIIKLKERKLAQYRGRKERSFLGPAIVKAGLGILIQERKRSRKAKSITS